MAPGFVLNVTVSGDEGFGAPECDLSKEALCALVAPQTAKLGRETLRAEVLVCRVDGGACQLPMKEVWGLGYFGSSLVCRVVRS